MEPDVAELRRSIARACRILALQGLAEDVLGHVSVRLGADRLLIRCRGPHERGLLFTTPGDVHAVPLDGGRPTCQAATWPRASCRFTPRSCGAARTCRRSRTRTRRR